MWASSEGKLTGMSYVLPKFILMPDKASKAYKSNIVASKHFTSAFKKKHIIVII
jgi:hypothetical protein